MVAGGTCSKVERSPTVIKRSGCSPSLGVGTRSLSITPIIDIVRLDIKIRKVFSAL